MEKMIDMADQELFMIQDDTDEALLCKRACRGTGGGNQRAREVVRGLHWERKE